METEKLKQRLVGSLTLLFLVLIFWPLLAGRPGEPMEPVADPPALREMSLPEDVGHARLPRGGYRSNKDAETPSTRKTVRDRRERSKSASSLPAGTKIESKPASAPKPESKPKPKPKPKPASKPKMKPRPEPRLKSEAPSPAVREIKPRAPKRIQTSPQVEPERGKPQAEPRRGRALWRRAPRVRLRVGVFSKPENLMRRLEADGHEVRREVWSRDGERTLYAVYVGGRMRAARAERLERKILDAYGLDGVIERPSK